MSYYSLTTSKEANMNIYTDYANWKVENFDLLNTLIQGESLIIRRIDSVIKVIDYLYDQIVNHNKTLDENEEVIFESGFNYLHDHFLTIKTIYENIFKNNYLKMDSCAKSINLLLYTLDFEDELLNAKDDIDSDMQQLRDIEDKIYQALEKGENVEDTLFLYLDEITIPMFERHKLTLNPVDSIFYQIAEEYNLVDTTDFDVYNDFINNKIEEDHHDHHH